MALKEVDWGLNDQIEVATTKFREIRNHFAERVLKEKQPLPLPMVRPAQPILRKVYFGRLRKCTNCQANQPKKDLIKMAKYVFTGQSGSNRKILLMGSDFNLSLSLIDSVQKQTDSKNTEVRWGLTWRIITTNFGEFNAMPYDLLDRIGMSNEAIIIDPDYIDKWTLRALGSKDIDTKIER